MVMNKRLLNLLILLVLKLALALLASGRLDVGGSLSAFNFAVFNKLELELEKFERDTYWWFFTNCHTFCNFLLKLGSKP